MGGSGRHTLRGVRLRVRTMYALGNPEYRLRCCVMIPKDVGDVGVVGNLGGAETPSYYSNTTVRDW